MRNTIIRAVVVIAMAGATYAVCRNSPEVDIGGEAGVVMKLPDSVGSFQGDPQDVSEAEKRILPKDTEFARSVYKNFGGSQINCQIVLSGGEKRSIHRPEVCLVGQGWTKKSGEVMPVKMDNGETLDVMKLMISRPVEVQSGVRKELSSVFLYWFVGKNMTTPYHWQRIIHTDLDRALYNVSHRWAYVIVSAPILDGFVPGGKNEAETLEMLNKFVAEVGPEIMKDTVNPQ